MLLIKQEQKLQILMIRRADSYRVLPRPLIGVMASHMDLNRDVWINAIKNTVPEKFLEMNLKAFDLGYNYNK